MLLRMITGMVAWCLCKTDNKRSVKAETEAEAEVVLGGCYHDDVVYSLGYDANGVVELSGGTFTSLDTGFDGGAKAALHRHRQNYDPTRDIKLFIVALKPVKVIIGKEDEAYGLPPGPLVGDPPTVNVLGEHVAKGNDDVIRRAIEHVKQDCVRRGVDISGSTVTVSVKPHDEQEAFARCEKSPIVRERLGDGEPCDHPGCLSHVSHPCEGCNRVAGRVVCESCGANEAEEGADCVECDKNLCLACAGFGRDKNLCPACDRRRWLHWWTTSESAQ